jgi:hypothetical protein
VKQADGSWAKPKDPADKGGDNNLYYEDKFAVLWNINSPAFEQKGCMAGFDAEKEPFDDSKYKAGDEVPGILVAPFTGDRGDLSGTAVWKDGTWTLVIKRRLVTGSEFDVQFDDLKKPYAFGVAVFDNAQVRHAFSPGVLKLVFE